MWRLVPVLRLALAQTWAQMGSCQGAGPVVAMFPGMPSFRANSVAPFVPSPLVAGKMTHLTFSYTSLLSFRLFCFVVSSRVKSFFSADRLQGKQGRVKQLRVRGWVNVCAKRGRSIWILVMKRKTTKRNQR